MYLFIDLFNRFFMNEWQIWTLRLIDFIYLHYSTLLYSFIPQIDALQVSKNK